ncbi:MAG: STAS domain-containing protein [Phycisphaerales bacterium]
MTIEIEDHGDTSVIRLTGGLTMDHTDALRRQCDERIASGMRSAVLDLELLDGADSEGLETLLWLDDLVGAAGGRLRLARANDIVKTILQVTRLDGRFDVHPDIESAARSLR